MQHPRSDGSFASKSHVRTDLEPPQKRKREQRREAHYPCVFAGCDKVFDIPAERAKHQKYHLPENERPHKCPICQKGFLYPKDLKRHQDSVHRILTPPAARTSTNVDPLQNCGENSALIDPDLLRETGSVLAEPSSLPSPERTVYFPLDGHDIRLLTILPSHRLEHISCRLENYCLGSECPEYTALSYTWGAESETHSIVVNGAYHNVRPNLYAALQSLRMTRENSLLWVDAICIDQQNPQERSQQVCIMDKIFYHAREVCVWLGDENNYDAHTLNVVKEIYDFGNLDIKIEKTEALSALTKLVNHAWFSRLWVMQEVILARDATLHCGGAEVPWTTFETVISLLHAESSRLYRGSRKDIYASTFPSELVMELRNSSASRFVLTKSDVCRFDPSGKVFRMRHSLLDLLFRFATFHCTDPRDRVFALLSMASDGQHSFEPQYTFDPPNEDTRGLLLRPDYEKDVIDIYKEVLRSACSGRHAGNLDILCRPWAADSSDSERLPTWICSLSRAPFGLRRMTPGSHEQLLSRRNGDPLASQTAQGGSPYAACGLRSAQYGEDWWFGSETTLDRHSLFIKGFVLDKIEVSLEASQSGNISEEWLLLAGLDKCSSKAPDALWRTLVADRGPDGRNCPAFYKKAFELAVLMSADDGLHTTRLMDSSHVVVTEYLRRLESVVWNRRLFKSADLKLLGLGPKEVMTGDCKNVFPRDIFAQLTKMFSADICILHGVSVPTILRSHGTWFSLIGECYVHGMMDGQALDARETSKDRSFELR